MAGKPPKASAVDAHSSEHVQIHDRIFSGKDPLIVAGDGITVEITADGKYIIRGTAKKGALAGYQGEYDQTKTYFAGQWFVISESTMIAGISVAAGIYAVDYAGKDSKGKVWAGNVPGKPTGNAVPQYPLPDLGAPPNDKYYARPIMVYCGGVL